MSPELAAWPPSVLKVGTVKNSDYPDPINTKSIFQGFGGYNPDGSGIANQATPIDTKLSTGGLYADSGGGDLFHFASYVENTGTRPTVAVFGAAKGNHVFGGNFVAYSNGPTDSALGVEIDFGNLSATPGGQAYGLVLKSLGGNVGGQGGQAHIQMQAAASSPADNGIIFHVSGGQAPVASAGALIKTDGGAMTVAVGIDFGSMTFTTAALVLPPGGNIALSSTTGTKIGTSAAQKLGFFNKAPVAQAAAIAAPTAPSAAYVQAEAQSMKTAVDAIRAALTNIGITA